MFMFLFAQCTEQLEWFVFVMSKLESDIVAVERVKEYTDQEKEADWLSGSKGPPPRWLEELLI